MSEALISPQERVESASRVLLPKNKNFGATVEWLHGNGFKTPNFREGQLEAKIGGKSFARVNGGDVLPLLGIQAADIGFTGSDTFFERRSEPDVIGVKFEQISSDDDPIGKFVLAVPERDLISLERELRSQTPIVVASKYPRTLMTFADEQNLNLQRAPFTPNGSLEIMILLGVSAAIFDITVSGKTLRDHKLGVLREAGLISLGMVYKDSGRLTHLQIK